MRMHNNNNNNTPSSSNDDDNNNNNNKISDGNDGNGSNTNNNNSMMMTTMHHQGNDDDDDDDDYYYDFSGVSGNDEIMCQLLERGLNPDLLFPTLMDNHTTTPTTTSTPNDIQQQQQQHATSSSGSSNNALHHANNNNNNKKMMIVENMNNYNNNNNNNNNNVENDDDNATPPVILLPPSTTTTTTSSSSLLLLASSSTTTSSSNQEGATTTIATTSTSQCNDDNDNDNNNNNKHHHNHPSNTATTTTTTTSAKTRNNNNNIIQQQPQQPQQLRKHPTGLGNLGNTCFMNSTLQCLAHTPPLRNYFLSGAYEQDLNVENPLGTGGELAREFASLMREMWLFSSLDMDDTMNAPSTTTITGTAAAGGGSGSNGIYASSRMYSPGNGGSYPTTTTTTTTTSHSLSNGDTIGGGHASSSSSSSVAPSTVTYPRSFKSTLGKHAPQFIGYDQHDSQELAIYLLDALHEDTNRIRTNHKPYVENIEQSTSETDEYAAQRAWKVHLQREDSFIVHNFMGQIKSRLQCPNNNIIAASDTNGDDDAVLVVKEGEEEKEEEEEKKKEGTCCCGRVSTTFDPCMYLSVPIPGSTDRVMKVVFVPCLFSSSSSSSSSSLGRDGKSTTRSVVSAEFTIKLCKNSTIKSLRREVVKSARECYGYTEGDLDEEDVQLVDIFSNKIWSYYDDLDRAIDGIKDSDVTFAYQLFPLKRVKEEVARYRRMIEDCSTSDDEVGCGSSTLGLLDAATKAELDTNNKWENKLLKFVAKPTAVCHMLNEKKSNHKERVDFYGSLIKFIQRCQQCPDATADGSKSIDGDTVMASPSASSPTKRLSSSISQPTLEEVSYTSSQFKGVRTPRDLAILEYCVSKYLARINKLNRIASNRSSIAKEYKMAVSSASTDDVVNKNENGLEVQIKIRKNDSSSSSSAYNYGKYSSYPHDSAWKVVGDVPMVVRIAPTLTVSGLRQLLGQQLLHSCCTSNATSEDNPSNDGGCNHHPHHHLVEDDQNQTMEEEMGCSSSPHMMLCNAIQEAAFSWEDDTSHGSGGRGGWSMGGGGSGNIHHDSMEFGSVSLDHFSSTHSPKAPDDEKKEMELVASIVKNRSTILVSWPPQFNDVLDESALCAKEEYLTVQQRKEMMEEDEDEDDEKEDDMILSSAAASSSSSSSSFSTSDNGNKKQKMKDKVEQTMKKKKKKGISIMDCIHKYCEMEQLDESDMWYCNQCKEHVRAWKQFHLYRTPPILIVHLKRFHYSSTTHRRDKIDTLIDFPLTDLDLRSVVKHNHWEAGQEPIYDCYAVSNHFGGLGGGHYTAYARWGGGGGEKEVGGEDGSESSWCLFDDSRVTACVDESEVVSSAAYCLYYKRKDVVFEGNDVKDVEKGNEKLMRVSTVTTETMNKDQLLGVNHPNVSDTEGVVGLVSRMMPVRPATSTRIVEDDSPTLPLPPPHVSVDDANSNDAAMDEVVDDRGSSSSSSAASYVTPNTSLHDDGDDEMMNDIII